MGQRAIQHPQHSHADPVQRRRGGGAPVTERDGFDAGTVVDALERDAALLTGQPLATTGSK
jgi:hypothetical protein